MQLYDGSGCSLYLGQEQESHVDTGGGTGRIAPLRRGSVRQFGSDYIRTDVRGRPAYLFDDHHPAFYGWAEACYEGAVEKGLIVLHFDAHADARWPDAGGAPADDLAAVAGHIRGLRIDDFIGAGVRSGLVSSLVWVDPQKPDDYLGYVQGGALMVPYWHTGIDNPFLDRIWQNRPSSRIVTDIDYDFFQYMERADGLHRVRGYASVEEMVHNDMERMRQSLAASGMSTHATSPGFIGQILARQCMKDVLN